jgi:hypothetical protein
VQRFEDLVDPTWRTTLLNPLCESGFAVLMRQSRTGSPIAEPFPGCKDYQYSGRIRLPADFPASISSKIFIYPDRQGFSTFFIPGAHTDRDCPVKSPFGSFRKASTTKNLLEYWIVLVLLR